jgi:anti-sigma factor RsiW
MAYETSAHASHDLLLVASLADGDASGPERHRAQTLIEACSECAALHADLVALATATRALLPVARVRDFRLTPADAARLRPAGWRRFLDGLATSRDAVSRPLALGLTTLGLAGLLAATIPSFLAGSAGGAATTSSTEATAPVGAQEFSVESDDRSVFNGAEPGASADIQAGGAPAAIPAPNDRQAAEAGDLRLKVEETSGLSPLVAISGVALALGLGLFALRWGARRLGDG